MFKVMIFLKRREGMGLANFKTWWLEEHVPLAKQLLGLRKMTVNIARGDGDLEFDGVSELWFDSKIDFDNAYATDIGKQVAADSMAHACRRERFLVDEHFILEAS